MAEDKAAFDKECEVRRSDLARIQKKRVQEFDLLTTTAGLDLIHIIQATEPSTPVESVPPDLSQSEGGVSNSPRESFLRLNPRHSAYSVTSSAGAFSQPPKTVSKDHAPSSGRVVPQYVPMVMPKPKPSPEHPTPETTRL